MANAERRSHDGLSAYPCPPRIVMDFDAGAVDGMVEQLVLLRRMTVPRIN
jgi:hypothetical protein